MSFEVARLRATAHPLRLRMLSLLTGAELSASQVARELDITQANASYHLRVLAEAGLVEVAGTHKIRGGVAKTYRHPWREAQLPRLPATDEDRHTTGQELAFVHAVTDELRRRVTHHVPSTDSHFTDAELWVSPEDWAAAEELVTRASHLLHGNARPPRSEGAIHVNMTAALFRMHGAE